MADLGTFARRIRQRGRQVEEGANRVLRQCAIAVSQTVILATPVDTGRARANWQANVGSPITSARDEEDKSGAATIAENNAVINSRRSGESVYISNNVPYIGLLNEGSSAQAPAGFVEQAVQRGINAVRGARILRP